MNTYLTDTTCSGFCQNGGTCRLAALGQYECDCAPYYSGQNCEIVTGRHTVSIAAYSHNTLMGTSAHILSQMRISRIIQNVMAKQGIRTEPPCEKNAFTLPKWGHPNDKRGIRLVHGLTNSTLISWTEICAPNKYSSGS